MNSGCRVEPRSTPRLKQFVAELREWKGRRYDIPPLISIKEREKAELLHANSQKFRVEPAVSRHEILPPNKNHNSSY